jgi:hypothetical protein
VLPVAAGVKGALSHYKLSANTHFRATATLTLRRQDDEAIEYPSFFAASR